MYTDGWLAWMSYGSWKACNGMVGWNGSLIYVGRLDKGRGWHCCLESDQKTGTESEAAPKGSGGMPRHDTQISLYKLMLPLWFRRTESDSMLPTHHTHSP